MIFLPLWQKFQTNKPPHSSFQEDVGIRRVVGGAGVGSAFGFWWARSGDKGLVADGRR